jgi:hypothetical protein
MAGLAAILLASAIAASPPQKVTFETSYGTVTLDHAAHISRRSACDSCHGPGQATAFKFPSAHDAHAACQSCHEQEKRGPTECAGCHVKPAAEPPRALAAASAPAAAGASPGAPPAAIEVLSGEEVAQRIRAVKEQQAHASAVGAAADASQTPSAAAAAETPAPQPATAPAGASDAAAQGDAEKAAASALVQATGGATVAPASPPPAAPAAPGEPTNPQWGELGAATLSGRGSDASAGLTFRYAVREGRWFLVHSIDWAGLGPRRIAWLVGGGGSVTVKPDRSTTLLAAVAGFDAGPARTAPVIGGRIGLVWRRVFPSIEAVQLSGTALFALTPGSDARVSGGIAATILFSVSPQRPMLEWQ